MAVVQLHVVYDYDNDFSQGVFNGTPTTSINGNELTIGAFNIAYGQGWCLYSDISQDPGYTNNDSVWITTTELSGTSIVIPVSEGIRVLYFFNRYSGRSIAKVYVVIYPDNTELCTMTLQSPGDEYTGNEGWISAGWSATGLRMYIGLTSSYDDYDVCTAKIGAVIGYQDIDANTVTFTNRTANVTTLHNSEGTYTTLAAGQTIYLAAINSTGAPIWEYKTTLPALASTQLPAPVVSATATGNVITPTWAAVANAFSYKVRYSTSNPPTGDGFDSTSGSAITGLAAGTTYYIQAKAIGNGSTYTDSDWSAVCTATTTLTQLATPTVTTTATDSAITPTWAAVANASSYKIRYGTSNPPTGDGITTTSGTAIGGLTSDTTYYIQVKAVGDGTTYSDSDWSTVVSQATSSSSSGDYTVTIAIISELSDYLDGVTGTFNPSTGLTLSGFTYSSSDYVRYLFGTAGDLVSIDPVAAGESKVLSSITTPGTYQIQIVDDTTYLCTATATVTIAGSGTVLTPLDAPTVTTAATETTVTPTWAAVANASSYKVRYGTSNPPTGDGETTTSGTAITGLTAGTVYYVQTKAIGDDETYSDSEWSTVSSVRTSKTWVVTNATDTPASGLLTIREAIANAFTGDTIHFSPSIANSTIVLGGTELFIDGKGLVIDGESNNITLSGNNASMVLRTAGDTNVCVFRNLKITQGSTSVYHGAGICNYAILTVENCVIYNNQATDSKFGGGVFSGKSLLMKNCLLYGNTATNGGAVGVTGTDIVTIDHCTICNNTATVGGAIYGSGTITLIDSIIHNNIGSTSGIASSGTINASYTLGPSPSIWTGTNSNNYAYDGALPLFVDLANNYFALAYNSQALGKSSTGGYVGSPALLQLAPPSPSFSASGETTFTGSWNDVANATSYAIRYGTVNPPTGNGTSITSGDTVSGLTRGTVYYIQVKTVGNGTAYCDSDWSTVQSITTDGVALIPLSAPTVTTTATSSTIVATVATVEHATAYKVRYSSTNPPTGDGATYVSGTDISGLGPSTNYYLQFKSVGDGSTYSDSDWGEVITQATTFITFKIVQTTSASVNNLPIVPGTLIIVTDTQTLYVDIVGGTRIILSAHNALNARISTLEGYHAE